MIATDHVPHDPAEKTGSDIRQVDCGFPGVETQTPLMLDCVAARRLLLTDYVRLSAGAPARAFGLYPAKGALLPGSDADIAVVDLAREDTLTAAALHSRGRITPFEGQRVRGVPVHTLVRGRFVMRDRTLVQDSLGWGQPVGRIQRMPPAQPRNTDQTMAAVTTV